MWVADEALIDSVTAVSGVDGATILVDGTVAAPAGLRIGQLVAIGPTGRESRPVIISNILPRGNMDAMIEAVDLAPEIYQGI